MASLAGKVAVVTGASRGIGKGIALELGALGATVYVTGRSSEPGGTWPGTVGQTAEEITELGGKSIAVVCDHHDDTMVSDVFRRVGEEQGRLDVLANNVFSSPDLVTWIGQPFWTLPLEAWDQVIDIGVRSHYVASVFAVPLLLEAGGGLIANVSSSGAVSYAHNVGYGVGKAAVDKFTADATHELSDHNVAVVSVWPGLVKTEFVLSGAVEFEPGRHQIQLPGQEPFELTGAESPRFTGRAVAALATDPDVMARSGKAFEVARLAADYGFTDIDGRVPEVLLRPEAHSN